MDTKYTVLVVDDNIQNLKVLGHLLEDSGYNVVLADSGKLVFEYLETDIPDLVLLDIMMPGIDGYEVITELKKNPEYAKIPVIFITAKTDADDIAKGFELGAVDYVCKPFNWIELKARVKTHIKLKEYSDRLSIMNKDLSKINETLKTTNKVINTKNTELKSLVTELDVASKTDYLTGLYNRRYTIERINAEIVRARRSRRSFATLLADIDHFKSINDTYGHDCGDEVLRKISAIFSKTIREVDCASRWGGEEFLLLIVEIGADDALSLADRLRYRIEKTPIMYDGKVVNVTVTIGVAVYDLDKDTAHDVITRADNALYVGKRNGRNRVVS